MNIPAIIRLLRPKQWIKNVFVLAPLLFTGQFTDASLLIVSLQAFALFCVASSATYIVNDYRDIESDRKHPEKARKRPLASGEVSKQQALVILALLLLVLLASSFFHTQLMMVIGGYLLLTLAYSFGLKHQPVIDIFVIAIGFVLRVYAGAVALDVPVSSWMFVTTLCLALFLGTIKRRQELLTTEGDARKVLGFYSVSLVDRYAEISATGALLFYSLFVISTRPELDISIPLVLYGLFRYWFLVETQKEGESPTDVLFRDWHLQVTIVAWVGICFWVMKG